MTFTWPTSSGGMKLVCSVPVASGRQASTTNAAVAASAVPRWVSAQRAAARQAGIHDGSRATCLGAFSRYAAIIGVSSRATTSEKNTAIAAVQPNWRKNFPARPSMNAVGRNTATRANVVAITASPISSAARAPPAARLALGEVAHDVLDLHDRIVHRIPTTSDSDSRVMMMSVNPIHCISTKVGRIDSGSATALTRVARTSRRNRPTTSTASTAPSSSSDRLPR